MSFLVWIYLIAISVYKDRPEYSGERLDKLRLCN